MDLWRLIRHQWDRAAAIAVAILGLVAVLLGWIGVSGKSLPAAQIPYLASGAVLGVVLVGIAATLWISADLRDEWGKLDEIHRSVTDAVAAQAATRVAESAAPSTTAKSNGSPTTPTTSRRSTARSASTSAAKKS